MKRASIHGEMLAAIGVQRPGSEHERREDALRPRGARLVRGRDDDVVVTGHEPIPPGAVEMMIAVLVDPLRHTTVHGTE